MSKTIVLIELGKPWKIQSKELATRIARSSRLYLFVHISETFDIFITVVTFCNENDALSAILSKPETFHVAIVEVMIDN